jgi:hypothetical protein
MVTEQMKVMGIDTMIRTLRENYVTPFSIRGWIFRDGTKFVPISNDIAVHYGNFEWITDHKDLHGKVMPLCNIYRFDLKNKKLLYHGFFGVDDLRIKGCMAFAGV